jgi:hypothetical protein
MRKVVEGSDRGLIEAISQNLTGNTRGMKCVPAGRHQAAEPAYKIPRALLLDQHVL